MNFIEKLKEYVTNNDDFEIVNIAGSIADQKRNNRKDEFSDIDLFIITEKKDYYLKNVEWLNFFDEKFIYFNDPISMGVGIELRIAYESGLLVDMAIINNREFNLLKQNSTFCEKILDRGMINIKNSKNIDFLKHEPITKEKISESILNRKIDEFWIDIANIYKYLKRGDFFSAKYAFDRRITKLLIFTMEEYAKTIKSNIDVMFNGRYMDSWLDENSLKLIYKINSSTDINQMLNCIDLSIDLFEDRMKKIFDYYGYKKETTKEKIILVIKERINELKIIKSVVDKILMYNYGLNRQKLEKILKEKVQASYRKRKKLNFVIPAFPGKSPNKYSCFSYLPDYTENISINSIRKFIKEIEKSYPFGCNFTIIHDGHFFIKLGITRKEIELNEYISAVRKKLPSNIRSMTIYDLMKNSDLEIAYKQFKRLYVDNNINDNINNIDLSNEILFTKYEFFDKINIANSSNNQIQMRAKIIAKESLKIKKAVNNLIEEFFPDSIRLSVHYQDKNSVKMGFKLIPNSINKGTPWFYVAYVSENGKIILGKTNWIFKNKKLQSNKFGKYYLIDNKSIDVFLEGKCSDIILKEKGFNR